MQSGDTVGAIAPLERATQSDPTDYQAFMYLGAAYGQAKQYNEAMTALTQAVTLQPSNAQARYNLGLVMEQAGYAPQALEAYGQALQLQPDYAKAQEAVNRLQSPAAPLSDFAAPPIGAETQIAQNYAPPASGYAPPAETPTQYAPQGYAPQQPAQYAPPPGQPMQQAYGQQPPAYGQPTMLPGQPTGYAPNSYGQPPTYPGGFAPGAYRGTSGYVEDKFDLRQAALDWWQVIRAPKTFFEGQYGRTGYKAPIAFLLFSALAQAVFSLIGGVFRPAMLGLTLAAVAFSLTIGFLLTLLVLRIGAAMVHGIGKMFGNQGEPAGSFRALAYCQAPFLIFSVITSLASPLIGAGAGSLGMALPQRPGIILKQSQNTPDSPFNSPRSSRYSPSGRYGGGSYSGTSSTPRNPFSNPALAGIMALGVFGMLLALGMFLWYVTLLVMGISSVQQISGGAAVGVVIISLIVAFVILIGVSVVIGIAFAAMFAGMR